MKKLLGAVFALVMVVASALGFAACSNSNDAETAQKAVNNLKVLYDQSKYYETSKDFEVLGEVSVNGTNYTVEWSVSSESGNVENYITFGTVDAESKMVTASVTLPETAIEYKLNAKVTVGKESASASFNRKLVAKAPDAAGTADDPYVPGKVMEIASTLGDPGTYYYSDADKGAAVPTRVWVEGYIVDVGNGEYFKPDAVGWVYIADSYDPDKTYDENNSLCIYRIEYDTTNLTSFDDLVLGKKIKVNGHIEWYQGKNDNAPYAELASFKTADGYSSVYCDYLEKVERTPAEKVELALSKVSATMTVTVAGDVELPESTVTGVTFTWSTTDTTYTVSDGTTLHVNSLPTDNDKQITITVTASCGTEASDTKNVIVTIKKAIAVEEGSLVLTKDILFPDKTSTSYADYNGEHTVGDYTVTTSNVMGNTNNTLPVIQLKASGGSITLNGEFKSIVIVVETSFDTWDKPTVKVGGTEITPAIDDGVDTGIKNGSYTVMRYTLTYTITATGSQAIAITNEATHAIYAESITLSGATGGSTTPGGETHTHNYSYTTDTTAWQHTGTCTAEGECTAETITEDCTIVNNKCSVCQHEYEADEILEKLFALTANGSLKGSYKLTGKVLRIDTAYASNYHNITFTFKVNDRKLMAYRAADNSNDDIIKAIAIGDEVVISGTLKLYNGTYEFDSGCIVESHEAGILTDEEKIMGAIDVVDLSKKSYTEAGEYTLPTTYGETANQVTLSWVMKAASEHASINSDGKLVITNPPAEEAEATLTVTVSAGSATPDTKDVTIKIIALSSLITNAGDEEHPLTVAEALKILNILSKGETYQSGGADKEFYIKGYVTDVGQLGTSNGKYGLSSVYIADSADTAKEKSLLVYDLNWDNVVLVKPDPIENPLYVGDLLIIKGYLTDYNGTKEVAKSGNKYPTATQWDKVARPTEPTIPEDAITANVNIQEYAEAQEHKWDTGSTKYTTINLDSVAKAETITNGSNTGKYYVTNNVGNWRLYKSDNATLTISVEGAYHLVAIKITWTSGSFADTDEIVNGKFKAVEGKSIVLTVASNIQITDIEVAYIAD